MTADFYCGACDIYHSGTCDSCGGPFERDCVVCSVRMVFEGDEPPDDMICGNCAQLEPGENQ